MTTHTIAVHPIISSLAKAYAYGNASSNWNTINETQRFYLINDYRWQLDLELFSDDEMSSIASDNADDINLWCKSHGSDITLDPFVDADDYGVASMMKIHVQWKNKGEICQLSNSFKAVRMTDDVTFTYMDGHTHPIAHIQSSNGDIVHMSIVDDNDIDGLYLLSKSIFLSHGKKTDEFSGLIFPMVDYAAEVDISFLQGMNFYSRGNKTGFFRRCYIKQARAFNLFQMDHLGAKTESSSALAMSYECYQPMMTIDKPFYVWMTRNGVSVPYFAGLIDTSSWIISK